MIDRQDHSERVGTAKSPTPEREIGTGFGATSDYKKISCLTPFRLTPFRLDPVSFAYVSAHLQKPVVTGYGSLLCDGESLVYCGTKSFWMSLAHFIRCSCTISSAMDFDLSMSSMFCHFHTSRTVSMFKCVCRIPSI